MREEATLKRKLVIIVVILVAGVLVEEVTGAISDDVTQKIHALNAEGPYLGIVVPNNFEMSPLLRSTDYKPNNSFPYLDFAGRRFRFGTIKNKKVIVVMTGLSMLNAGITTQLLLSSFKIKGVLHFGIAGNANPKFEVGDVTIPEYWAHISLWNWQRFGQGPNDELSLESNGDYTRRIGFLNFSNYNINGYSSNNLLNNVWYQPEEIFPIDGQPETRQHAFWVPADKHFFLLALKLEGMKLQSCVNATTCLPRKPEVKRVRNGVSANSFVDNRAYREFLHSKFNATAIDMESAAIALVCLQQRTPFITIRALSDLAGGGDSASNEAAVFSSLAAQNVVDVLLKFITFLY